MTTAIKFSSNGLLYSEKVFKPLLKAETICGGNPYAKWAPFEKTLLICQRQKTAVISTDNGKNIAEGQKTEILESLSLNSVPDQTEKELLNELAQKYGIEIPPYENVTTLYQEVSHFIKETGIVITANLEYQQKPWLAVDIKQDTAGVAKESLQEIIHASKEADGTASIGDNYDIATFQEHNPEFKKWYEENHSNFKNLTKFLKALVEAEDNPSGNEWQTIIKYLKGLGVKVIFYDWD